MLKELKWLNFPKTVRFQTCTTVYKALNGLAHEYISDICTRISMFRSRNLLSVDNDLLRILNPFFYETSFTISAAKPLNVIPLNLRTIEGLNKFKIAI